MYNSMLTTKPPWWDDTKDKLAKMMSLMMERQEPTNQREKVSTELQNTLKEHFFRYEPSERKDAKFLLEYFKKQKGFDAEEYATAESDITKTIEERENRQENPQIKPAGVTKKLNIQDSSSSARARSETEYSVTEQFTDDMKESKI